MLLWNTSLQWHDKWRKRLFIYFLRDGHSFSYTCFGRWYFLLANQIAHLTTHKPVKIHVIKIKVKLKFVAQASTVWMKWFQLWMLVNLTEKEGNFQNIQVLEEKNKKRNNFIQLKMKVTKACPIWQPKNIFETLKRVLLILPCKVLLVNTVLLPHTELKNLMSIIADEEVLFYFDNVSEKITFYEKFESQNKAADRPCEVCCQTIRDCTVGHSLVWVSWIFGKKRFLVEDFITDWKGKIYLENWLLRTLLYILTSFRLSSLDEVVQLTIIKAGKALKFFLLMGEGES